MTLGCYDCGLEYGSAGWIEAVVPHDIWNKHISPTGDEGGILCITCMAKRAEAAGLSNVPVKLTAGVFAADGERAKVIEECAELVDTYGERASRAYAHEGLAYQYHCSNAAAEIAQAIRALATDKGPSPVQVGGDLKEGEARHAHR